MNSFKDMDISFLITKAICPTCGGDIDFKSGECPSCYNNYKDISESFKNLENTLKTILSTDIPLNMDNCINLITLYISKNKSSIIKEFVTKQQIPEKIDKYIDKIDNKLLNNQKLDIEENYIYSNLLKNNLISKDRLLNKAIFRSVILKQHLVDKEVFFETIKIMVTETLKDYNNNRIPNYNPKCIIENLNLDDNTNDYYTNGSAFLHKEVNLDINIMDNLFEGYFLGFQTIFHEMYHIIDAIDKATGIFSRDIVRQIQEDIIKKASSREDSDGNKSQFYKNNYDLISNEKDAEIRSFIYLIRFLEGLGLDLSKEFKNEIQEKVNLELAKKENLLRNVSDNPNFSENNMLVDEIFNFYIKNNPSYLTEYPQLTVGYIEEDGMVRPKTIDELLDVYTNTNDLEIIKYIEDLIKKQKNITTNKIKEQKTK